MIPAILAAARSVGIAAWLAIVLMLVAAADIVRQLGGLFR